MVAAHKAGYGRVVQLPSWWRADTISVFETATIVLAVITRKDTSIKVSRTQEFLLRRWTEQANVRRKANTSGAVQLPDLLSRGMLIV
jgi:hypothetical protein